MDGFGLGSSSGRRAAVRELNNMREVVTARPTDNIGVPDGINVVFAPDGPQSYDQAVALLEPVMRRHGVDVRLYSNMAGAGGRREEILVQTNGSTSSSDLDLF